MPHHLPTWLRAQGQPIEGPGPGQHPEMVHRKRSGGEAQNPALFYPAKPVVHNQVSTLELVSKVEDGICYTRASEGTISVNTYARHNGVSGISVLPILARVVEELRWSDGHTKRAFVNGAPRKATSQAKE